jgi:hypothetical protein
MKYFKGGGGASCKSLGTSGLNSVLSQNNPDALIPGSQKVGSCVYVSVKCIISFLFKSGN